MDTSKLRPDTAAAWKIIENHPLARGFVLIGGTALTMHIRHRVSEDLDFAYVGSNKRLPESQIGALRYALSEAGMDLQPNDDPLGIEGFIDSGLDLLHYQRDFIANGSVKISFVSFDPPMDQMLLGAPGDPLRVATLDELFETKVFTASERCKTRDWLDLYTLMTSHGYSMRQAYALFERLHRLPAFNSLQMRLRLCKPFSSDEGYQSLMDSPPDLATIRKFFIEVLDQLEIHLASERNLVAPAPSPDHPVG